MKLSQDKRGFTLIEIMIVVLIIGILMAIAVPNFLAARHESRTKACIANLKQIDSAEEQYNMKNGSYPGDFNLIVGTDKWIKTSPVCPDDPGKATSSSYNLAANDTEVPTCKILGASGSNTSETKDHILP